MIDSLLQPMLRSALTPSSFVFAIGSALLIACGVTPNPATTKPTAQHDDASNSTENGVAEQLGTNHLPGQDSPSRPVLVVDEKQIAASGIAISPAQQAAGIPHLRFHVSLEGAPSRGPENAPVTVVMFSDFECPYCRYALDTIEQLESEYKDQIRFVYKALPLDRHPDALVAGLIAHSAHHQNKFWEFHNLVFSDNELNADRIENYIAKLGLNREQIADDLEKLTFGANLQRDIREGDRLDIRSTPTFFVNGRRVQGAKPIEIFRRVVDEELSLVDYLKSKGEHAKSFYDQITEHAYAGIEFADRPEGLYPDSLVYVPVEDSPQRGPNTAPLTLVVFADFQCPYCTRGQQTVHALEQRYGDKLRVVYKHYPLARHDLGALAARASVYAHQQKKFWELHDRLYQIGPRFTFEDLLSAGEQVGFDRNHFAQSIQNTNFDTRIEQDMNLGRSLGVDGTPMYFLNGRPIAGALPELRFRLRIAEELERAQAALDSGVAPEALYQSLTKATK